MSTQPRGVLMLVAIAWLGAACTGPPPVVSPASPPSLEGPAWPTATPIDAILYRHVWNIPTSTPTSDRPHPTSRSGYLATVTYIHLDLAGGEMRSGKRYNPQDPSIAATNWYPLGTTLRLMRIDTGRTITVTVQDTGSEKLTIDMSEAGFMALGALAEGRIPVLVEEVTEEK